MLKQIKRIDIEFQSFCNRMCPWCPNSFIDRHSFNHIMDEELFINILKQINENGFFIEGQKQKGKKPNKVIAFRGFMEPMSNIELFKKYLNLCHQILPHGIFYETSTNGDFLTKENLIGLNLHRLNIMDYDCKGEQWWIEKLEDLECALIHPSTTKEKLSFVHESINLIQVSLDWPKHHILENRGGLLDKSKLFNYNIDFSKRQVGCFEMNHYLSITHNGLIMPCCHIRDDIECHIPYILGDLKTNNLSDILCSQQFINCKKLLNNSEPFTGFPGICDYCSKIRG